MRRRDFRYAPRKKGAARLFSKRRPQEQRLAGRGDVRSLAGSQLYLPQKPVDGRGSLLVLVENVENVGLKGSRVPGGSEL